jgi:ABC-type Fe3+-siderophore transport system permease subunit
VLVAWFAWPTAALALVAAYFIWRDYRRAHSHVRRMVFAVCALGFVAVAIVEACLAIWH